MTLLTRARTPAHELSDLDERVRRGGLRVILPGIYSAEEADSWEQRVEAAQLSRPEACLIGPTAARLMFWPDLSDGIIHLAPARFRHPPPWLSATRTRVPDALVVRRGELRMASPALAALQLSGTMGARSLCEVLRRRAATVDDLQHALSLWPDRAGNEERQAMLRRVRDNPWSVLETEGHHLLRKAEITGWQSNVKVRASGRVYYLDVAFPELRIAIEWDGWTYHNSTAAMAADSQRQNTLILQGWTILRYTSATLTQMPRQVRRLISQRRATTRNLIN